LKLEVEVKLKISRSHILALMKRRGIRLKKVREVSQRDIFFDFSDLRLFKRGCGLRVRIEPSRVVLCYKGPKTSIMGEKARAEVEWELGGREEAFLEILEGVGVQNVSPPASLRDLLEMLKDAGLKETVRVEKLREEFLLPELGCKLCIDRVKGLGEFAELEGPACMRIVRDLGLERYIVRETYAEMVASSFLKSFRKSLH